MRVFFVFLKGLPNDFLQVHACSVECSSNYTNDPVLIFRNYDLKGIPVISLYLPVSMVDHIEEEIKNVHVLDDLLLERVP